MNKQSTLETVVWLLIATFVIISSLSMGIGEFSNPRPGFFPFWAGVFLAFFAFLLFGIHLRNKEKTAHLIDSWKGLDWVKNVIIVAALISYCLVLPQLGYILATSVLMLILFYLGKMKPWAVILASLLAVFLSYGLFYYVLKTPLPQGILAF